MESNLTSGNTTDCHGMPATFIPFLYIVLFPIAMVLNSAAAWISLRVRSTSTFMVYLKSLVLSDIVETLMIPFEVFHALGTSTAAFHMFYCRYLSPIKYICMYISISLMGVISLDRFFKIVQPCGQVLGQNLLFGRLVTASIWVLVIATTGLPTMVLTNRHPNASDPVGSCMAYKGQPGIHVHRVVTLTLNMYFWLVCVLLVACYICIGQTVLQSFRNSGSSNSRAKQKTKLRVFLVLWVFLVSFSPYHVVRIPYTLQQTQGRGPAFCRSLWSLYGKELGLLFATVNVCLDPVLYFFLCREYSEQLRSMITAAGNACGRTGAVRCFRSRLRWLVSFSGQKTDR